MTTPTDELPAELGAICDQHPYDFLFATVSGAHLYGFPSPDSDYDLRGVHILPLDQVVGLDTGAETVEDVGRRFGPQRLELDLVTHDVAKFFRLMLRRNGYVLEQLHSPLVVRTGPEHAELQAIARTCVTRHHVHHYLGFARNQRSLFLKESPPRVKPLLYVYRVLLTGIHLMRTGEIQANLPMLADALELHLPWLPELLARKTGGDEKVVLPDADLALHEREYGRLEDLLNDAADRSTLPEEPAGRPALHDLLIRVRLARGVDAAP